MDFWFCELLVQFLSPKRIKKLWSEGETWRTKAEVMRHWPTWKKNHFLQKVICITYKRFDRKPGSCMFSCMWISSGRLGLLISETYLSFSLFFLERQLSLIYWLMFLESMETLWTSGPYISLSKKQEFPEIGLLSSGCICAYFPVTLLSIFENGKWSFQTWICIRIP